jgi:hypothetical protein
VTKKQQHHLTTVGRTITAPLTPRLEQHTMSPPLIPKGLHSPNENGTILWRRRAMGFVLMMMGTCFVSINVLSSLMVYYKHNNNHHHHHHQQHSAPLSYLQQHQQPSFPSIPDTEIRIMSWGSSSTLGHGLAQPRRLAYPYLLSPLTHNYAMAQPPSSLESSYNIHDDFTWAAACTQSMVSPDQIYDVITIEYSGTTLDAPTRVLALRLRERFPHATLIFIRLWRPSHMVYQASPDCVMNLHEFRQAHGNLPLDSKELYVQILESDPTKWSLQVPQEDPLLQQTLMDARAFFLSLSIPPDDVFAFPQTLYHYFQSFQPHMGAEDLSPMGHAAVAQGVLNIIQREHILERPDRHVVGGWGSGDECHLGSLTRPSSVRSLQRWLRGSPTLPSSPNDASFPYTRYVTAPGETIEITNPFAEERMLYLSYLTSGTHSDDVKHDEDNNDDYHQIPVYPKTHIHLNDQPSVVLDPVHDGPVGATVVRTVAVGRLPPGRHTLHVLPQTPSQQPFAWMGTSWWSVEMSPYVSEYHLPIATQPSPQSLWYYYRMWWR